MMHLGWAWSNETCILCIEIGLKKKFIHSLCESAANVLFWNVATEWIVSVHQLFVVFKKKVFSARFESPEKSLIQAVFSR
jgi:hypothetical protein